MYLTIRQQVKHLSRTEFHTLRELCRAAKNLTNEALYTVRQHFFATGKYLSYPKCYKLLKNSTNYRTLNSNMAQQILKEVDGSFKSFFGLLKKAQKGDQYCKGCRLPHYLPKDGYATLIIGYIRINGSELILPYSNTFRKTHRPITIRMPAILKDKTIREIRIIPKADARFFEVQYTYEAEDCIQEDLNYDNALALDLGITNLITAASSEGHSFIIDGKRLKSINRWYNKENARLQGIKDKQKYGKSLTRRQSILLMKRNNRVNDYISKAARQVVDYCVGHKIGTLVLGWNKDFQRRTGMGRVNNQSFVNIPYGKLKNKLSYLCQRNGITLIEQEESYTSKASFWDGDEIPTIGDTEKCSFSGQRIHRGLYQTSSGKRINADVNGALNILKKSSVVSLEALYGRGEVDTPVRIRVA